jgi:HEPN domain-containing protein
MKKLTAEWVAKAEADWQGVRKLARAKPPLLDLACFHCQQTAEKYMKALLQEQGLVIPYTHDLEILFGLLLPHYPDIKRCRRGLDQLSRYAGAYRYPGMHADLRNLNAATRRTELIREECRRYLGIATRQRRRKAP